MIKYPYADLKQGTLLIANPDGETGVYNRSVVLICEHTPAGSFGLIVNKPLQMEIPEDLLSVEEINHPKVQLRLGGKMQQNQMMLLHTSNRSAAQTLEVCPGVYLGGDLPFLQESIKDESCEHLLLCFGYTGWSVGELEKEFMSGLWYLHPGSKDLVFHPTPNKLWQNTLQKMGGHYATIAMIPEDLSLN